MSHTNSTTNYSLPQFVTTDKPAWLTDVNNAYSAIDTGMYNAQTKANTADSNATQALSDASDAATAAATADAKGSGALASIANTFDATVTYSVGDMVLYNNLLYICEVAVITPGPWTGLTNWARITVEDYVNSQVAAAKTALEYQIGDSISLQNVFIGYMSSGSKRVRFTIPLDKPLSTSITDINFSSTGDISLFGGTANDIITPSLANWSYSLNRGSIYLQYESATATTLPNSTCCAVYFNTTGAKITFA